MAPLQLTDEALERVEALATADASAELIREGLEALPADQREAVLARVLEEQDYAEIASRARTSESVGPQARLARPGRPALTTGGPMTDFVDDLEAELLAAARRRRTPPPARAAGSAAPGARPRRRARRVRLHRPRRRPEPERQVTKPQLPVQTGLPVAGEARVVRQGAEGRARAAGHGQLRAAAPSADRRRRRRRLAPPIARTTRDRTRRVGHLGVVPTGAVLDCARAPARASGSASLRRRTRRAASRWRVRAGKAFALVEEPDGARLIGARSRRPDAGRAHPAARSPPGGQGDTVDDLFVGLRRGPGNLELERRTAKVAVINFSRLQGPRGARAVRLRARLGSRWRRPRPRRRARSRS